MRTNANHYDQKLHQKQQEQDAPPALGIFELFHKAMMCGCSAEQGAGFNDDDKDEQQRVYVLDRYAATPLLYANYKLVVRKPTTSQARDDDTATTTANSAETSFDLCSVSSIDACVDIEDHRSQAARRIPHCNSILEGDEIIPIPREVDVVLSKLKTPPIFPPDLFENPSTVSTITMPASPKRDRPQSFFEQAHY